MGIALTAIFLMLAYLSPADLIPSLGPYRIQLWFAALALLAGVFSIMRNPNPLRMPQVYLMLGLFFAVGLSRFSRHHPGASLSADLNFAVSAIPFYFVLFNSGSLRALKIINMVLISVGIYLAIQGILSYILVTHETAAVMYVYDAETGNVLRRIRGLGFLADPNDLAQYFLIVIAILGIGLRRNSAARLTIILPVALLLVGILLTKSRGGMLGIVTFLALTLNDKLGRVTSWVFGGVILLGLLAFNFTGGRAISMTGGADRLAIWSDGLGKFKASPLWGIGYDQFTSGYEHTAHNSFVLCFTELGLIGYFFWLALIIYSLYQLRAIIRLEPKNDYQRDLQRWAKGIRIALFTFLVTSWFLSRTYNLTFYLLIAIIASLTTLMQQETRAPSLATPRKQIAVTMVAEFASILLVYATLRARSVL